MFWLLELTITYETVMDQIHQLKMAKNEDLVGEVWRQGYQAQCIALEVGSRGLLIESELS